VQVGNFELLQSIELPISNKDTVTLSGKVNTNDSFGSGVAELGLRRVLTADTYMDVKIKLIKTLSFLASRKHD
jgi:hypothetical protein